MILTTHILSGATLGAAVKNPYAVAGFSIVLHFLLDFIPHGDYLHRKSKLKEFWKVVVDLFFGLGAVYTVLYLKNDLIDPVLMTNIVIGIFFSLLPDGTTFLYNWMKVKFLKPVYDFHRKLHLIHHPDFAPERKFRIKNNRWDIVISAISLLILFVLR